MGDAPALRPADDVCTALQLLEHRQDVGEDRRRGRVYLAVAGGWAAADALRRSGGATQAASPRVRRRDVLRHLAAVPARSVR